LSFEKYMYLKMLNNFATNYSSSNTFYHRINEVGQRDTKTHLNKTKENIIGKVLEMILTELINNCYLRYNVGDICETPIPYKIN